MRFAIRGAAALFLIVALVGASACRLPGSPSGSTASSTRQASVAPSPVGPLDAAVPTPPAFPADVPVYPCARLTAGAAFSADGVTTWCMEWETLDSVDKVKAFYTNKLAQGDWTIQFNGGVNGIVPPNFRPQSR